MLIAANAGNVVAQNKLAHLYINAIGTRPNRSRRRNGMCCPAARG